MPKHSTLPMNCIEFAKFSSENREIERIAGFRNVTVIRISVTSFEQCDINIFQQLIVFFVSDVKRTPPSKIRYHLKRIARYCHGPKTRHIQIKSSIHTFNVTTNKTQYSDSCRCTYKII